jgi:phosphatidylglycerophosphate synthase
MNRSAYISRWRSTHSAPELKVITIFLSLVYFLAMIFIKLKFKPNHITFLGGAIGISAAALSAHELWLLAGLVAIFSSFLDGVDGAVAELTDSKTKFGAVLDVVIDRIVEVSWFMAFVFVGGNLTAATSATLLILIMEYLRTKANSLGIVGAGGITIAERPTRVIMFAMLNLGVYVIGNDNQLLTIGLWTMTAITMLASIQLFFRFTNQLRHDSSR